MHQRIAITILLLVACVSTLHVHADGNRGQETAHLEGEAKTLADELIVKVRKGWEKKDFETYQSMFHDRAKRTWGRSEEAGEHDIQYKLKDFLGCVKIIMAGKDIGTRIAIPRVEVEIQDDIATTRWTCIISNEVYDYVEHVGEKIVLKKIEDQWMIIDDRSWMIAVEEGGKKTVFTDKEWERRDAAVQSAKESGNPRALAVALMASYRMSEAYDVVVKITQSPDAQAIDWSQRGYLATVSGHPDDIYPSFKRAKILDPEVWIPAYAIPREEADEDRQ